MDWTRTTAAALLAGSTAVAGLVSGAAMAAPAGGVTATVTPQRQSLGRSDDVVVTVTLTNTSNVTQYLLKWQTPFDAVEAPLFEVTRDGLPVRYLGIQAKRLAPTAADYVALKPGASRSVRVELSALYDMHTTGAYSVRYRPGALQAFSRPGLPLPPLSPQAAALAEAAPPAASIWIEGRLPRGAAEALSTAPGDSGGLATTRCSNAQQETVAAAVQAAQAMAVDGETYMQRKALAARYTGWFGAVEAERATTVAKHFIAIRDAFATKPVTVDCGCNQSWYAYVYPDQPYKIHVCKAFWSAPMTGTDSKGGTLVHEMSHFNVVASTDDWAYGQAAASGLATSDPGKAVDNADSHEYFGENEPHQDLRAR